MDGISLLSMTYRISASVPLLTVTVHKDKIINDDQIVQENESKMHNAKHLWTSRQILLRGRIGIVLSLNVV